MMSSVALENPQTYSEESPTVLRMGCRRLMTNAIQLSCLFIIPLIALSLVLFMTIFAIRCDGSGGFVIGSSGNVICASSDEHVMDVSTTTLNAMHHGPEIADSGLVVMTVTRVVLISVSVVIISFTAWICAWYQRYGNAGGRNATTTTTTTASSSTEHPLQAVVTVRISDLLIKEDLERLLGPELRNTAPAV